ncbi:anti-sigma factor family protein [Sphingomonas sp. GB1N7]|uniref:anti-sigma factor family protein n=1 Tax=Parasphingomonas caseinilytica TaxID=3096158 RepID=UPI002FC66F58
MTMGRVIHLRGDPHDETQALLPWHVTGRLDSADRLLVEAHLATCAACREDLALERRLGAAIRELPLAADEQWERMAARLSPRPADHRVWWRRPVHVAWFIGAQAAVILLCIGLVASQHTVAPPSASTYRALGDTATPSTGNVLVMFTPALPPRSVRAAIAAARARLIDGPTETGAYLLAVAPADRDRTLATLRARPDVTLAQPVDAPNP